MGITGETAELRPPPLLYHYTDTAGLLGIVRDRVLWATDVLYLNDREELNFGSDAVVQELHRRADEIWPFDRDPCGPENSRANVLRNAAGELKTVFGSCGSESTCRVYVACFCECPDLLSLWRGYGRRYGYTVGFDTEQLAGMESNLEDDPSLVKVRYGLSDASDALNTMSADVAPSPNAVKLRWCDLDGRRRSVDDLPMLSAFDRSVAWTVAFDHPRVGAVAAFAEWESEDLVDDAPERNVVIMPRGESPRSRRLRGG